MSATKRIGELDQAQLSSFNERRDRLCVTGFGLKSPFFDIQPGVILSDSAIPLYDRPVVREAPSVVVIVWGIDHNGEMRLGMVKQKRPPADDPRSPGDDHKPVTFVQVVMGYLDGDSIEKGAHREKAEELGAGDVMQFEIPELPLMNVEPNMFATWHRIAFMRIDLKTVDSKHMVPEEFISGVMYLPVRDVLRYIAIGWDEQGNSYREGHTLMILMIFFSTHPELFPRP